MKGLKKQFLGTLLTTAIAASAVPAFAVQQLPDDVTGTKYEKPIQILSALDIMNGDENGQYRPDDTIIRSEVTKMVIHALGLEDAAKSAGGVTKFPDVKADHWANGYINLATSSGIIIGDDNGFFRPNDAITYAEAMTIMVRALGYEPIADQKGGFPSGYMSVATSNGLTKNVEGSMHEPIKRGSVAFLTTNTLETNLMEQTGFGSNINYEVVDKTLLVDKLKVTRDSGQITAIPSAGIEGDSSLAKGQIKIGDNVYETAYNMNNLLGYNVEYYVKTDNIGTETVILALPEDEKNKTLNITGEMFNAITTKNSNKAIEYYKSEDSSRVSYAELSPKATLIYNGKYSEMSDELLNMKDKSGKVTLLDTDRDGKYDIAFVTYYENMVVEEVTATGKIVDKYGLPTLKLDENVDYRIRRGLEEIEVTDLQEYDVLSIAASKDKEVYDIIVTNKTVEGKVTGNNDKGIFINNELYKIAANYTQDINIGVEGTFYLDVEGKIAALDTTSQLSTNYAYLIRAFVSTDADDIVKFKVFTKSGEETVLETTEKIRFNGKGGQNALTVFETLKGGQASVPAQLITYTLNSDGKISSLNTALDNTSTGAVNENKFTKNAVLQDAVFNAKLNTLGNIKLDSNTIIFDIPDGSDEYEIASLDMFEDEQKYNAIVYDKTEDFAAKAIIVTNSHFQANADSSIAVVKEVSVGTNDEDETTEVLTAFIDGEEKDLFAESEGILEKAGDKKLAAGDIIQYKTNTKNEIVSVRVLFDIETKENEATSTPIENLEIVYGKVIKKFTDSINVTVNDGAARNFPLSKDVVVYTVDTAAKQQVTVSDIGDIQKYDTDENNRVFIKLYKDVVQEVVIVK